MATAAPITGAPPRAPENHHYRPDTIDAAPLLAAIERHIVGTGIAQSMFGRAAVGDPCLIRDLRSGCRITPRRADRVRAYIEGC